MARFQNSFKIACVCVISFVVLLYFFHQDISFPQQFSKDLGTSEKEPSFPKETAKSSSSADFFSSFMNDLELTKIADANTLEPILELDTVPTSSSELEEDTPQSRNRSDFWSVDHGRILPGDELTSQNRQYTLNLSVTGELTLYRHYNASLPTKPIFWTNNNFQWVGHKWAAIDANGWFQTYHQIEPDEDNGGGPKDSEYDYDTMAKEIDEPFEFEDRRLRKRGYDPWEGPFRTWSSVQYPECKRKPEEGMTPIVVLTDNGALQIKHLFKDKQGEFTEANSDMTKDDRLEHVCEIFEGEREEKTGDMGRLAVVLTGTLRSWKRTCRHINDKVLNAWPGKGGVDVFVATKDADIYDFEGDDGIPWVEIQDQLNRCFEGRLRLFEHIPLGSEPFPDLESTGGKCIGGMQSQHRLYDQVKSVYRGGQLLMQYTIRTGAKYDYVLKMRPDHLVWGDAIPPFQPLDHDVLLYPMPYWEPPTWSMQHTGISHSTPSDQMAFGRLLPMMTYLNLYPSYVKIVRTSQEPGAQDYPPCFEPMNPCPDWEGHSPCFIEGLSGYWPVLNGIRVKVDWRWKVNLLRAGDGEISKGWKVPWNRTQGTRYAENGFD